jgi:hypothetical protein
MLGSLDGLIERFNKADSASDGLLGKVTSLITAFGGVSAVVALLGRLFGFKAGIGLRSLSVALPLAVLEGIEGDKASGGKLNTALRGVLGIEAEEEGPPLPPGWGKPGGVAPGLVSPRPRKHGDAPWTPGDYGEDHGAYNFDETPLPRPRPSGATTMNITQTNNIDGAVSPHATAAEIKNAHRELGDALRNMYQKVQ